MSSLGERMKGYEAVSAGRLLRRCPVIVRVDGRAFHTWTRGFEKPFDPQLIGWMQESARRTAHEMQGCKLAYVQSDEASFLLTDFDTLETEPWFGYELPKVVSLSASIFTAAFQHSASSRIRPAHFDARAFNVPFDEVANYFLWRAKDAKRNSIQGLAQAHFSPKQLHGVKTDAMVEMLREKGVEWDLLPNDQRFGSFLIFVDGDTMYHAEPSYPNVSVLVNLALPKGAIQD